mmetsp:Transcript_2566/g.5946  ORF Transcript_2566/g.5946 Transcript_2566/m.5946 type:complete len:280 (+) Transcript_2566:67-906(+)
MVRLIGPKLQPLERKLPGCLDRAALRVALQGPLDALEPTGCANEAQVQVVAGEVVQRCAALVLQISVLGMLLQGPADQLDSAGLGDSLAILDGAAQAPKHGTALQLHRTVAAMRAESSTDPRYTSLLEEASSLHGCQVAKERQRLPLHPRRGDVCLGCSHHASNEAAINDQTVVLGITGYAANSCAGLLLHRAVLQVVIHDIGKTLQCSSCNCCISILGVVTGKAAQRRADLSLNNCYRAMESHRIQHGSQARLLRCALPTFRHSTEAGESSTAHHLDL